MDDAHLQVAALDNGVSLAYDIAGAGARLVFIHGAMGDWRSWDAQWDVFSARYRCLRYSRRYNHPNPNTMPSPHHSAIQEAEDLRLLLRHLHWDDAILVGSSYGAFVALMLAVQQPGLFRQLVAAEPPMMRYAALSEAGRRAEAAFRSDTIEPANAAFRRGDDVLAAQLMTGGINGRPVATLAPDAMARRLQNIRAMKMLALSSDEFPWITPGQLSALPMPVMLVAGRNTAPIHAEIFRNVCQAMPQAQVQWIDQAGHGASRDNPEQFNQAVSDFLQHHENTQPHTT